MAVPGAVEGAVREERIALGGDPGDYDRLLARAAQADMVLIGEASHGTHEFYAERATLTRRLIVEHGFNAVAVEADWPQAWRVDRYVRGEDGGVDADDALSGFRRFPRWMWRNTVVLEFVEWLREHNAALDAAGRTGFYGLDLYSLYGSIEEVLRVLGDLDPDAAAEARERYACFGGPRTEGSEYARGLLSGRLEPCAEPALQQLLDVSERAAEAARRDGGALGASLFSAEQNAWLVVDAEEYYRSMYFGRGSSWNLRDTHMVETLARVVEHLSATAGRARVVVWEHNSHLGDARATEMGQEGDHNVGQLARERFGDRCYNIGFTTFTGEVTAADDWGDEPRRIRVRPGLAGSYEQLLHDACEGDYYLMFEPGSRSAELLAEARLERAIGVIYRPATERRSHYFRASLPRQFDAVIHLDETRALQPLDPPPHWIDGGDGRA